MERTPPPERLAELIERLGLNGRGLNFPSSQSSVAARSLSALCRLRSNDNFPFTPLDPRCRFFHLLPVIIPFRHDNRPHA
jgi:hypothetical protein